MLGRVDSSIRPRIAKETFLWRPERVETGATRRNILYDCQENKEEELPGFWSLCSEQGMKRKAKL
jgi:hypothetical protein